jgi:hypothetical protein
MPSRIAPKIRMLAFLMLLFSIGAHVCAGQLCESVLPQPLDTKKSKAGDHILLRTTLFTGLTQSPVTTLDTSIVEVRPRVNGSSAILRIRVNKVVDKEGHEHSVEARIVAVISKARVTESWDMPIIIADRFPRTPADDQREPGERKLSESQPHSSPVDSVPDAPALRRLVCPEKKKNAVACVNVVDARGTYGYKNATLLPADPAAPTESVLSSKKNMAFPAGTILVLQVKCIP